MNVLLYQNKPADYLKLYLEYFGYNVTLLDYSRINTIAAITNSSQFDLMVLEDVPEIDCFSYLSKIGAINAKTPKILLTGNNNEVFLIRALELEFNVILFKPISPRLLFAHMKLIADPMYIKPETSYYIDIYEDIVYNATKGTIEKGKQVIVKFGGTESRIFKVMLEHINRPVKKADLVTFANIKNARTFDVYICSMRNKLKAIPFLQITKSLQKEITLYLDPMLY